MEKRTISFSPPDISEAEINEVAEALRSGWITTGPRTKKLEKEIARLEKRARAEKQPRKKFELVQRIKKIKKLNIEMGELN